MQRWEYMRIYHYLQEGTYQVNGEDHKVWRGQRVDIILNQLGSEGWELVSVVGNTNSTRAGPATTSYYFFLKRPRPDT